jgi:hypothetical protein
LGKWYSIKTHIPFGWRRFNNGLCNYGQACRRSGAGVGVLNGFLYAIGGHDGPMVRRSVEKFDSVTKSWTSAADMSLCRRNAGEIHTHNHF